MDNYHMPNVPSINLTCSHAYKNSLTKRDDTQTNAKTIVTPKCSCRDSTRFGVTTNSFYSKNKKIDMTAAFFSDKRASIAKTKKNFFVLENTRTFSSKRFNPLCTNSNTINSTYNITDYTSNTTDKYSTTGQSFLRKSQHQFKKDYETIDCESASNPGIIAPIEVSNPPISIPPTNNKVIYNHSRSKVVLDYRLDKNAVLTNPITFNLMNLEKPSKQKILKDNKDNLKKDYKKLKNAYQLIESKAATNIQNYSPTIRRETSNAELIEIYNKIIFKSETEKTELFEKLIKLQNQLKKERPKKEIYQEKEKAALLEMNTKYFNELEKETSSITNKHVPFDNNSSRKSIKSTYFLFNKDEYDYNYGIKTPQRTKVADMKSFKLLDSTSKKAMPIVPVLNKSSKSKRSSMISHKSKFPIKLEKDSSNSALKLSERSSNNINVKSASESTENNFKSMESSNQKSKFVINIIKPTHQCDDAPEKNQSLQVVEPNSHVEVRSNSSSSGSENSNSKLLTISTKFLKSKVPKSTKALCKSSYKEKDKTLAKYSDNSSNIKIQVKLCDLNKEVKPPVSIKYKLFTKQKTSEKEERKSCTVENRKGRYEPKSTMNLRIIGHKEIISENITHHTKSIFKFIKQNKTDTEDLKQNDSDFESVISEENNLRSSVDPAKLAQSFHLGRPDADSSAINLAGLEKEERVELGKLRREHKIVSHQKTPEENITGLLRLKREKHNTIVTKVDKLMKAAFNSRNGQDQNNLIKEELSEASFAIRQLTNKSQDKLLTIKEEVGLNPYFNEKEVKTSDLEVNREMVFKFSAGSIISKQRINEQEARPDILNLANSKPNFLYPWKIIQELKSKLENLKNEILKDDLNGDKRLLYAPNNFGNATTYLEKFALYKNKILFDFVRTLDRDSFKSKLKHHRRIYVVNDEQVILTNNKICGVFIDIPTPKYFIVNSDSKKQRVELFSKFLSDCRAKLPNSNLIKSIFSVNGEPILSIKSIPSKDKVIFVSNKDVFKGLSIANINEKVARTDFSNFVCRKTGFLDFTGFFMSKKFLVKAKPLKIRRRTKTNKPRDIETLSLAEIRENADKLAKRMMTKIDTDREIEKAHTQNFAQETEYDSPKNNKRSILKRPLKVTDENQVEMGNSAKQKVSFNNKNYLEEKEPFNNPKESIPSFCYADCHHMRSHSARSTCILDGKDCEIAFFSDSDLNKKRVGNDLSKYEQIADFYTESIPISKAIIKLRVNKKKHILSKDDTPMQIIDRFNKTRTANAKNKSKEAETYKEEAGMLIVNWFNTLNILKPDIKKENKQKSKIVFKDGVFLENRDKLSPDEMNRMFVQNIYFQSEHHTEKFYPDLMSLNPLRFIENDPYNILNPRLLYDLFCQFKVIMKLCLALNKSIKCLKQGLDFPTFHQLIPEVKTEEKSFAQCIFNIFNKSKSGYVTLDEFISGISRLRSSKTEDKIDIFMKILDSDGNGKLSYSEVHDLSISSLNRVLGEGSPDMKESLAELFAEMIFKICSADRGSEIELPTIRNKILLGGPEADYLEMFCCASR